MKEQGYFVSPKISSFGLESLLWNVEVSVYTKYSSILRYTFDEVVSYLKSDFIHFNNYTEANGIKKLFPDIETEIAYRKFVDDLYIFYDYDIKE